MTTIVIALAGAAVLLCLITSTALAKDHGRFVTSDMRANALRNVERFDWARTEQQDAIRRAAPWADKTDDELWATITSQWLPRAANFNVGVIYEGKEPGCPNCREGVLAHGNYPYEHSLSDLPWKVTCPNCKEVYPKNDFGAFYATALDEKGCFRRELGDQSLLFNEEHPDPKDPLHKLLVDDGYGMVDEAGRGYHPIAYFTQWALWKSIYRGVDALTDAYTLTGKSIYAHKAAVLLDRIADVYPEMDYLPLHKMGFQHSQGGRGTGRIEGCIWETHIAQFARAYDIIFEAIQTDEALAEFILQKAEAHGLSGKADVGEICRHIEDHLIIEALESCKDSRISGNTGMTHTCLAICAIALDRPGLTEKWLDWLYDPGFPGPTERHSDPVPWVLEEGLDRDGMGAECGGYGLIWVRHFIELAEILKAYPDSPHDLVSDYPKLKQCFLVQGRLNCLDAVMPNIGDSGATGTWGRSGNARTFARGYRLYRDPRLAGLAWHFSEGNPERLRGSVFDEDPLAIAREIEQVASQQPFAIQSEHLGRYGQAVLQTEYADNGRALWLHYGYGKGHSHRDALNIGLHAKNVDMLPDLGYPEFTGNWPKRGAWTSNTISHNTVVVDDRPSGGSPGGKLHLFTEALPLRLMDASSPNAYEGLETYRRTVALVDLPDSDSYVLDIFRVRGGHTHRLSYHGPAGAVKTEGLGLTGLSGTLAGPDIAFAQLTDPLRQSGHSYLYDIEGSSGSSEGGYTVDWKAEDLRGRISGNTEPHLRLHALTPCDEVTLASGDPPQNKSGNPRRLRYLLQSRSGRKAESQFVTVLEPYDRAPFIHAVRRLEVTHDADPNSVAAVSVELTSGVTDILISCEEPTAVSVEGGIELDGQFGMIRMAGGQVTAMRMVNGRRLAVGDVTLTSEEAAYTGRVERIDTSDPTDQRIYLDPPLPANSDLVGRAIHFVNEIPWDTTYDIRSVDDGSVSTGDITLIRGFTDKTDCSAGYTYLVNPGDTYVVPITVSLDR